MSIQDMKIKVFSARLLFELGEISEKEYLKEERRYKYLISDIDDTYIENNIKEFQKYGVFI